MSLDKLERAIESQTAAELRDTLAAMNRSEQYKPKNEHSPLTDLWNCERFCEKYAEDFKWCEKLGGWFLWDGTSWQNIGDKDTALMRWAKDYVKALGVYAGSIQDKRLGTHAIKTESSGKLKAIIDLAKSEVPIAHDVFDRNNHLLNCKNGTLDLNTGVLRRAERGDYITKAIDVWYEPTAQCPIWLNFLDQVFMGDQALVDYIQRALGYCLSGYTHEQKFFICYGNGRNGKSTLLKHVMYILGQSYASGTPAATMLEQEGNNTMQSVAALKGMRLVVLSEFDNGKTLSSATVKNMTGGEPVVARHLYHSEFTYIPTYKFWMTTNYKPRIKDVGSLGIWRRLVLIPFLYTIPADKVDYGLDVKLAAEYEGILAWAVAGYRKWKADGLPQLEALKKAVVCYQGDSDIIGQFLEDCQDLEANPGIAEVSVVEFMKAFAEWCMENSIKHHPGRSAILDYMDKKGFGRPARDNSSMFRGKLAWKGIAIKRVSWAKPTQEWGQE